MRSFKFSHVFEMANLGFGSTIIDFDFNNVEIIINKNNSDFNYMKIKGIKLTRDLKLLNYYW